MTIFSQVSCVVDASFLHQLEKVLAGTSVKFYLETLCVQYGVQNQYYGEGTNETCCVHGTWEQVGNLHGFLLPFDSGNNISGSYWDAITDGGITQNSAQPQSNQNQDVPKDGKCMNRDPGVASIYDQNALYSINCRKELLPLPIQDTGSSSVAPVANPTQNLPKDKAPCSIDLHETMKLEPSYEKNDSIPELENDSIPVPNLYDQSTKATNLQSVNVSPEQGPELANKIEKQEVIESNKSTTEEVNESTTNKMRKVRKYTPKKAYFRRPIIYSSSEDDASDDAGHTISGDIVNVNKPKGAEETTANVNPQPKKRQYRKPNRKTENDPKRTTDGSLEYDDSSVAEVLLMMKVGDYGHVKRSVELNEKIERITDEQGKTSFKCLYCGRTANFKTQIAQHILRIHNASKALPCPVCGKCYAVKRDLRRHILFHSRSFTCKECPGKAFKQKKNYLKHMAKYHQGVEPTLFECNQCDRKFNFEITLKEHIQKKHVNPTLPKQKQVYLCNKCGKSLTTADGLRSHMAIHRPESKLKCEECPATFNFKKALDRHIANHRNLRNIICDVCGKAFNHNLDLRAHKVMIHFEKKYCCPVCNKAFPSNHHLEKHMRVHTGEKPIECIICHQRFNDRSILRRHLIGLHKVDHKLYMPRKNMP